MNQRATDKAAALVALHTQVRPAVTISRERARELGLLPNGRPKKIGDRSVESAAQAAVVDWAAEAVGTVDERLAYLYAIPNGTRSSIHVAKRMKREGVRKGVSDLHLPVPVGGWAGLWIEMKAPGKSPTPAQRDWLLAMQRVGHFSAVCHHAGEAILLLTNYLLGQPVGLYAPTRRSKSPRPTPGRITNA